MKFIRDNNPFALMFDAETISFPTSYGRYVLCNATACTKSFIDEVINKSQMQSQTQTQTQQQSQK